jgi:hypothetical protein
LAALPFWIDVQRFSVKIVWPVILLSGCALFGTEQPARELSTVSLLSAPHIETSGFNIDGVSPRFFDSDIQILPGPHDAAADVTVPLEECISGASCYQLKLEGTCRARFRSEPGRNYDVRLSGSGQEIFIEVVEKRSGSFLGSGTCTLRRS